MEYTAASAAGTKRTSHLTYLQGSQSCCWWRMDGVRRHVSKANLIGRPLLKMLGDTEEAKQIRLYGVRHINAGDM